MGTMSPPTSPKALVNVFPARETSGPASRAIKASYRDVRANLMLAPSSPTPSDFNPHVDAPGWWLSTSSEPCVPGHPSLDNLEEKPVELPSDSPFDIDTDIHMRELSRGYYEWADSLI